MFSEATANVIEFEPRSRRKWDNALIADLDQNGFMDILATDHAYRANVFWNNGGTFSKPQVVIKGDTHGTAAADIDQDGRMDLIISQGGGGGKKPRYPVSFQINKDRTISGGEEFSHFERSRGRAVKLIDSDNNGSLNLVTSAFPLKSQKHGANFLYENKQPKQFEFIKHLPFAKWLGYKTLVTDFNNDGITDLFFYGGNNIIAVQGQAGLKYHEVTNKVLAELSNIHDVSSIAEIDYDNDGDFDLFLTRAKHQFDRQSFYDAENQRFAFFARNEKFQFDDLKITGDFQLENLQMAFPNFDVYIGKNKRPISFDVERHGGKNFSLKPEESKGWPKKFNKKGLYIGYLGNGLWRIGGDTKSPTAGVIKNVTSSPTLAPVIEQPAFLLENQNGIFVDATARLNIDIAEQTAGSAVGDFNNDGWADIFVVKYGNMAGGNKQIVYLNQAGKSFIRSEYHGVVSKELGATGSGADAFDYDHDGDLDLVYANERGRWHLFTNNNEQLNNNNYMVINVGVAPSNNATAQGAIMTMRACGNIYKRVVGATSAPFTHNANNHLHVGLGQCDKIDSTVVQWSTGEQIKLEINNVNQMVKTAQ